MLAVLASVLFVNEIPLEVFVKYSPTLPVAASSFVVVPTIPVVDVNVMLVADAAPSTGVVKVGLVAKVRLPVPVFVVIAVSKFALDGVAKNVAIPVPKPLTPVLIGKPVQFVSVPEVGVPKRGVTKVGEVANTNEPLPVSSVMADARLALLGVTKKVPTPVPRPDTPLIGRPVQFVKVPDAGVPRIGATKVGPEAKTKAPIPVSSVTALAKFALLGVARNVAIPVPRPLTPVLIGKPVQLVKVPLEGVPRAGVTKVGLVAKTKEPDPVSSVTAVAKFELVGVVKNVPTPVPRPVTPLIGNPVQFVRVPEVGVPNIGATSVGLVAKTREPIPVSSVTVAARLALEGVARNVAMLAARPLTPVEIGKPVQLVRVPALGVPIFGVVKTGEVVPANDPVPDCPESVVLTAFIVAITYPYATVGDPTDE